MTPLKTVILIYILYVKSAKELLSCRIGDNNELNMIILLSSLYMIYGFLFLFSYAKDIGFLRYMYEKKNINQLLTIELIFIILASFIVFTNQPLNWMVALIMIFHIFGVVWLIAFPDSFYSMYEESMQVDPGTMESMSGWILIAFGVFVYFSGFII